MLPLAASLISSEAHAIYTEASKTHRSSKSSSYRGRSAIAGNPICFALSSCINLCRSPLDWRYHPICARQRVGQLHVLLSEPYPPACIPGRANPTNGQALDIRQDVCWVVRKEDQRRCTCSSAEICRPLHWHSEGDRQVKVILLIPQVYLHLLRKKDPFASSFHAS